VIFRYFYRVWRNRFKYFLKVYRIGRGHGYPRCCVFHFSLVAASPWRNPNQAVQRGSIERDGMIYVPCLWHMRLGEPYPFEVRVDEDGRTIVLNAPKET
jgi:hypothetical protein